MERIFPDTGTIIATCFEDDGDNLIAATITLPESVWDAVTTWINDLHSDFTLGKPDLPVRERISQYLDLTAQMMTSRVRQKHQALFGNDLDDNVPF